MGAQSSELKARLWGASAAAILGLSLGLAAVISPAEADKVGVAAAVNPDAFSSLGGAPQSQLSIGKSIFFNERINTTGSGLVQVLLVDGSTFTVGPGSDLVIDKFVYDPKKGTGQIAASFSKGVMRFVGGKISKNDDGVSVKTPAGALAIRGAIAYLDFKSAKNFSILFVFGEYIKLQGKTIFEHGYGFFGQNGQLQSRPFSADDLKGVLTALNKGGSSFSTAGNQGGKTAGNPGNSGSSLWQSNNASEIVNSFTQSQILQSIVDQIPPPCVGDACNPTEEPVPTTLKVYRPGETYTFGNVTINQPGKSGILGGDPNVGIDDFQITGLYTPSTGRLTGVIGGPDNQLNGVIHDDCTEGVCTPEYGLIEPHNLNFPYTLTPGLWAITDATIISQSLSETINVAGTLYVDPGFFAYRLFEDGDINKPILAFGGTPYTYTPATGGGPVAGLNPGELHSFTLSTDPRENSPFPFASAQSSPTVPEGSPSPAQSLLVLQDDHPVWLQTSLYIGGAGSQQQSFVLVALGNENEAGGLVGERGGSSHHPISIDVGDDEPQPPVPQTINFAGGIATLPGPDDKYYFGTDTPHFVIGHDTLHYNPGVDKPLNAGLFGGEDSNNAGATYHVAVQNSPSQSESLLTKTGGTFNGYAAGMVEHAGSTRPDAVVSTSPNAVAISLNAETNTLAAGIKVTDLGLLQSTTYKLAFGDTGPSAYIDDSKFAALQAPNPTSGPAVNAVTQRRLFRSTTTPATASSYLVSSGAIDAESALLFPVINSDGNVETDPETGEPVMAARALCTACDFLKWGAWGTQVAYGNNTDAVHLGWWVAADIASNSDISTDAGKTATYEGSAVGNVANNLNPDQGWVTYVATGDLGMFWDFGRRSGTLAISHFDTSVNNGQGYDWSGTMLRVPGPGTSPNQFAGGLAGNDMLGAATGSFVRPIEDGLPKGVIGNWNVGNSAYQATGIFAGAIVPTPAVP